MIKTKVRLYGKDEKVQAAIKFKVSKGQPVEVSQVELLAILLAYKDVVLKDYSDFAAIQHLTGTIELLEEEMAANKEVKQDD